jgi:cryptochrome
MPPSVARVAGVEVGRDYPRPMVDHKVASKENIARMAEAFRENKKEKDGGDSGGGGGGRGRGGTKRKGGAGRSGGVKTYKMSK